MAEANKADLQAMSQQLQDTVAASLASFARDIASQLEAVRSQKPASLDSVPQSFQAPTADVSRGDLADTSTKYSDISSDAGEMPVDTATPHGDMFVHTRTGVMCSPPTPSRVAGWPRAESTPGSGSARQSRSQLPRFRAGPAQPADTGCRDPVPGPSHVFSAASVVLPAPARALPESSAGLPASTRDAHGGG